MKSLGGKRALSLQKHLVKLEELQERFFHKKVEVKPELARFEPLISVVVTPYNVGYNAHGPRPHLKTTDIQRKVYNLGIKVALSAKFAQERVRIVDSFHFEGNLKAQLKSHLKTLGLEGRSTFFIHGQLQSPRRLLKLLDEFTVKPRSKTSMGERPLLMTSAKHITASAIMDHEYLLLDKAGLELLEGMYHSPISSKI